MPNVSAQFVCHLGDTLQKCGSYCFLALATFFLLDYCDVWIERI